MYGHGRHKHHSHTSVQPHLDSHYFTSHEQTSPSKRTKTEPQFAESLPHHHVVPHHQEWSHDSHMIPTYEGQRSRDSHVRSHDPPEPGRYTPSQQFSESYDGGNSRPHYPAPGVDQGRWSDVGTNRHSPQVLRATSERTQTRQPPLTSAQGSQQRRGSLGGFSDDFSPLARNFPTSPAPRASSDVTQSQSSARYSESVHSPHRLMGVSRKRSSGTSDSDGNAVLTGDTEYQRLLPEESADEQLTNLTETETSGGGTRLENQITSGGGCHGSQSGGNPQDVRQVPLRRPQLKIRSYEASRRSLKRQSEKIEFRRAASLQQSSGSSVTPSLGSRQYHSDSETRIGGRAGVSLHSSPLLPRTQQSYSHSPTLGLHNVHPWNSLNHNTTGGDRVNPTPVELGRDVHGEKIGVSSRQAKEEREGEREGIASEPMQVSPVATHTFEISDKFSDVSTSAQVGVETLSLGQTAVRAASEPNLASPHQGDVSMGRVGPSMSAHNWREMFGGSSHRHPAEMDCDTQTNEPAHSNLPRDDPQQYDTAATNPQQYDTAATNPQQYDTAATNPQQYDTAATNQQQYDTAATNQQQYDTAATSTTYQTGATDPHATATTTEWVEEREKVSHAPSENEQLQPNVPRDPAVAAVYSGPHIMSPIAEVSQEFSTQPTATQNSQTQFTQSMHSLSPLPEQVNEAELRRSSSPFHHEALGDAVTATLSPPSAVSDNTNASITSQVARVAANRGDVPQLEPPSTSSDTSHSLTRSSEADGSNQPTLYLSLGPPNDQFDAFSGQDQAAMTAPTNTVVLTQFPCQQPTFQSAGNTVDSSSQITPTPEPRSSTFTPATAAAQTQPTQEVLDYHHHHHGSTPSSRDDSQGRSLQNSGAYQSAVSDGSRERYGGGRGQMWSTSSAPPSGYSSWHRRNRRSASPANTGSVLSDSVTVQFRVPRRQPQSEQGDQSSSHHNSGRRRHKGHALSSPSSSASRQHSTTTQRISQDLEMMTRAIEGMDSGNPLERENNGVSRDHARDLHCPSPPERAPQVNPPTSHHSSTVAQSRPSSSNSRPYRAVTSVRSPHAYLTPTGNRTNTHHSHIDFLFRHSPNPSNSLTALSQIPPNNDSPDMTRTDCVPQNLAQSSTPLTHGDMAAALSPVQFPSAVQMEQRTLESAVIPPPAESSDYLPPYSPPREAESSQRSTAATVVQDSHQAVYRDPPPSYEEIFGQQNGRRQRQRQRRPSRQARRREEEEGAQGGGGESQSQQDHTATHRHTRSSGHRKLPSLTSLFKRSRRHTQDPHSSAHRSSRPHPPEQPPQSVPNQEDPPRVRQESPEPVTLERTASWVASYSQTPRPITAYQQLERGFREFGASRDEAVSSVSAGTNAPRSSAHSQVSRAVSDTGAVAMRPTHFSASHSQPTHHLHQVPSVSPATLPSYRHPPPFSTNQPPTRPPAQRHTLTSQEPSAAQSRQPYSSSQQDPTSMQAGYTLNPLDHNTHPVRLTGHANSQEQNTHRPATIPASVAPAPQSVRHPSLSTSPVSPHSHSISRPSAHSGNLSQPNISLSSTAPRAEPSSPLGSLQQAPMFHRILAHPPRTRPISPLVTSTEYGRGGLSLTSPTEHTQPMSASLVDQLRNGRSSESLRGVSSHSQQDAAATSEPIPPRQLFLPWQLDRQDRTNEGGTLGVNGNANNDNPSPKASQDSPNATPKSSPVLSRRVVTVCEGENGEPNQPLSQTQNQVSENGTSQQDENGTSVGGGADKIGEKKPSQRSTQRSRAASRRLAQLSSSEEELAERSSSSCSQGRQRHRRKHGSSGSRSSSRQGNKSQSSPVNPQAPEYFPSFQSQPSELPQDSLFSSDLTAQSTVTSAASHDHHMTPRQPSHDQHQQEILLSQVRDEPSAKPEDASHDDHVTSVEGSHDRPNTSPAAQINERVSTPEQTHDEHTTPLQQEREEGSHDPPGDVITAVEVNVSSGAAETTSGQRLQSGE